jgi:hypothetical protein
MRCPAKGAYPRLREYAVNRGPVRTRNEAAHRDVLWARAVRLPSGDDRGGFLGGAWQLRNETEWHYAIHMA